MLLLFLVPMGLVLKQKRNLLIINKFKPRLCFGLNNSFYPHGHSLHTAGYSFAKSHKLNINKNGWLIN